MGPSRWFSTYARFPKNQTEHIIQEDSQYLGLGKNIYVLSAGILKAYNIEYIWTRKGRFAQKRLREITQIQKGVGTILKLCHALA